MLAQQTLNAAREEKREVLSVETAAADKGYYAAPELQVLQHEQIKTVIADPFRNRRMDKLAVAEEQAVKAVRRSTGSAEGKRLLSRCGMNLERPFSHILDWGGMRRTTLRGLDNNAKRFKLAAAFYNLSRLMHHLFGIGTPKRWAAMAPAVSPS